MLWHKDMRVYFIQWLKSDELLYIYFTLLFYIIYLLQINLNILTQQ